MILPPICVHTTKTQQLCHVQKFIAIRLSPYLERQSLYPDNKVHGGQHGAHLGPVGPRWAPCWPHEPCYRGIEIEPIELQNWACCQSMVFPLTGALTTTHVPLLIQAHKSTGPQLRPWKHHKIWGQYFGNIMKITMDVFAWPNDEQANS